MRGVFVQPPFEITLEVRSDTVQQGEALHCTLTVKNRDSTPRSAGALRFELATGERKRVKQLGADALSQYATCPLSDDLTLNPQEVWSFSWDPLLDQNAPVSDKSTSLFVLCGTGGAVAGYLPLDVTPHPVISGVFALLESSFQFVEKDRKASTGRVRGKFKPSSSGRYTLLEELLLDAWFEDRQLQLEYRFRMKRLEVGERSLAVQKTKRELTQQLGPAEYLSGGEFINHERIELALHEALATVASPL